MDDSKLLDTLARVANTLTHSGIRFALAGGLAVYARGGPPSDHDVDVLLKKADVAAARQQLVNVGMRPVDPPEDWLAKVYDGDQLVDLIFNPNGYPVTDALLDRAELMRVAATKAPVVTGTDLMVDKLLVLGPHRCDLTPLLSIARELREQVDWAEVGAQVDGSPYARAFLRLLDDLAVISDRRAPI